MLELILACVASICTEQYNSTNIPNEWTFEVAPNDVYCFNATDFRTVYSIQYAPIDTQITTFDKGEMDVIFTGPTRFSGENTITFLYSNQSSIALHFKSEGNVSVSAISIGVIACNNGIYATNQQIMEIESQIGSAQKQCIFIATDGNKTISSNHNLTSNDLYNYRCWSDNVVLINDSTFESECNDGPVFMTINTTSFLADRFISIKSEVDVTENSTFPVLKHSTVPIIIDNPTFWDRNIVWLIVLISIIGLALVAGFAWAIYALLHRSRRVGDIGNDSISREISSENFTKSQKLGSKHIKIILGTDGDLERSSSVNL